MKRIIALILASVMVMGILSSCGKKNDGASGVKGPEGTPSEIISAIYEKKNVELMLATTEIDKSAADQFKAYTGLASADKVKEAAASEAMIGSQAYSLVVVRVNDASDTEAVATEMKNGIDQRKWICVEADDLRVVACGDVIMLVMISSELSEVATADELADAFKTVSGGTLTVDLK